MIRAISGIAGLVFAAYGQACYNDGAIVHGFVIMAAGLLVTATSMHR